MSQAATTRSFDHYFVPEPSKYPIFGAVALLLFGCIVLTVQADSVMRYTQATANMLHSPDTYVRAVMSARPKPSPTAAEVAPQTNDGTIGGQQ